MHSIKKNPKISIRDTGLLFLMKLQILIQDGYLLQKLRFIALKSTVIVIYLLLSITKKSNLHSTRKI